MTIKNRQIEKKTTNSFDGLVQFNVLKQWKGGRLKKRLNAHASCIGQLMHSFKNVIMILMASWLSPEIISRRFLRGNKNSLICLSLLIDNNNKN